MSFQTDSNFTAQSCKNPLCVTGVQINSLLLVDVAERRRAQSVVRRSYKPNCEINIWVFCLQCFKQQQPSKYLLCSR